MQVILLEKFGKLGDIGDKVKVKAGYGRNYLIPQGKAVFATEKNIEIFESRRTELEANARERLDSAQIRASKLAEIGTVKIKAMPLFILCSIILGIIDLVFHDKNPRITPNR